MSDSAQKEDGAWTIGRIVTWATADFRSRGLASPRLEAELLLSDVLGVDRVRLLLDAQKPLGDEELRAFRSSITRRRGGEPTAYILGQREFFGHKFMVNRHVLVPRPDTELLVEVALKRTKHRQLFGRALDLCTGSGCVAVSFALQRRTWRMTGTDLSSEALDVARSNALALGAIWGMRFLSGDLFAALPDAERFELIIANPPYIASEEVLTLEPTVRDFEPNSALDGGTTGLDFYPRLVEGARRHLVPGGILAVEVGAGQAADVADIFLKAGFSELEKDKDYGGHERVVSVKAPR